MKKLWVFLAAGLGVLPLSGLATQSAQATFFCWSLRFHQGQGSFDETLDLSTISGTPNGELAPWYSTYTHRSSFVLDYSGFPITGMIYLDLPPYQDANSNGFDDSFEVSQSVSGSSSGEYTTAIGGGTVSASWNRSAGSRYGTCSLHLVDDNYGDLGYYQHTFEAIEYNGTLNYTPGSNTVSGNITLTNESGQIQGPVTFGKSITNPYNALTLQNVPWTNGVGQAFSLYSPAAISRDQILLTNYYGTVEFNDGDLNTSAEDYYTWELSINDLNDSDSDTIPDFSDDPQNVLPRQPVLMLTCGTTNLWLTISGDVGHIYQIVETTSLAWPNWVTNQSLLLTNDPQAVSLPLPATMTKFWRAFAN